MILPPGNLSPKSEITVEHGIRVPEALEQDLRGNLNVRLKTGSGFSLWADSNLIRNRKEISCACYLTLNRFYVDFMRVNQGLLR